MPVVDLRQNYRFEGRLYREGRNVDVPPALAKVIAGMSPGAPSAPRASVMPYADMLIPRLFADERAVRAASDEDILAVDGIGPARLAEIRAHFAG